MAARSRKKKRPGQSVEERENQLISLAADLAERQLAEGTASAQVITHFLKLGTQRAKLEMEKIEYENNLLQARTESLESAARIEELYTKALGAMRKYQGDEVEESEGPDE